MQDSIRFDLTDKHSTRVCFSQTCWPQNISDDRKGSDTKYKIKNHCHGDTGHAGSGINSRIHLPSDTIGYELLLLRSEHGRWEKIEQAIDMRDWSYVSLTDLPADNEILDFGAKVLIIDTKFLPELSMRPRWGNMQAHAMSAIYFISDYCDIETRMQTIQAGARKLFVEPIDISVLITEIEDCIQPKKDNNTRVLVVTADDYRAKPTVDMLHSTAYVSKILNNPLLIIDTIWGFRPDAILIMDLGMTTVDCIVLTKLIREREESLAIPVIIISDDENRDKVLRALQAGADDFLSTMIKPEQILATIRCRIERSRAFSTAGVRKPEVAYDLLPDRKAMLSSLERILYQKEDGVWSYGVIFVTLKTENIDNASQGSDNSDRFFSAVAEKFMPILQVKDFLARVGRSRLAILIRRGSTNEVKRLTSLCFEIVKCHLSAHEMSSDDFSVSFRLLENLDMGAEEFLQLGERDADASYMQKTDEYVNCGIQSYHSENRLFAGAAWRRDEFLHMLQTGSVTFQTQRYVCCKSNRSGAETVELIPLLECSGGKVDLYQHAALCGAAFNLDSYICEKGISWLYDYSQDGKWIRLILRQSTAVLEEDGYIDNIKEILRTLHMVGNGLVLEFSLPSLASNLHRASALFKEILALGIGLSLSHFPCNERGFRALRYLQANIIRPRTSFLDNKTDHIQQITNRIHSMNVEIILPYAEQHGEISRRWMGYADYIGAVSPRVAGIETELNKSVHSISRHGNDSHWNH